MFVEQAPADIDRTIDEWRAQPFNRAAIKLGLDEEDSILLDAILRGLDNPATLPALDVQPDGSAAAPGLAALIDAGPRDLDRLLACGA